MREYNPIKARTRQTYSPLTLLLTHQSGCQEVCILTSPAKHTFFLRFVQASLHGYLELAKEKNWDDSQITKCNVTHTVCSDTTVRTIKPCQSLTFGSISARTSFKICSSCIGSRESNVMRLKFFLNGSIFSCSTINFSCSLILNDT